MAQGSGKLVGAKLWLVPRYSETPGSIIRLGSILTDPEDLESSLNLHEIPPIPEVDTRSASQALRRQVLSDLSRSNSFLVQALPNIPVLSGLGAGASASAGWHRDAATTVDALNVNATIFIPSAAYMDEALQNEAVMQYARKSLFGKPLYVVVGTATASRLTIREDRSSGQNAGVGAHIATPGMLGEAEVSVEHSREMVTASEFDIGEECDFAYRVREFFYSKVRKSLKDRGNFAESALFGRDQVRNQTEKDKDVTEVPKFEWFEEEDPRAEGTIAILVNDDG